MKKANNVIYHLDMANSPKDIKKRIKEVWGQYMAYHIFNVPDCDYIQVYEELAESLGEIRLCHPVNDKSTKFSKSRDIKYNPDIYHYFASNARQPLHTDYAYYRSDESPDWLILFCIKPSEYGGNTNILSTKKMVAILAKYNQELLEKIKIDVTWKYYGEDGDKLHKKSIYNGEHINWNYWQIKEEHNSEEVMNIREEFFRFLEDVIVGGSMYDFSKTWKSKDCIIFNDKLTLHGRDAFLGDRWLKDHAFFEKIKEVKNNEY